MVTGASDPEVAHIFPYARTNTLAQLMELRDSLKVSLLFYDADRDAVTSNLMTSHLGCLEIPENLISLDRRLHRLWDNGSIAFWWMGANPPVENTQVSDDAGFHPFQLLQHIQTCLSMQLMFLPLMHYGQCISRFNTIHTKRLMWIELFVLKGCTSWIESGG